MITESVAESPTTRAPRTMTYALRLVAGPIVFALVMWAPVALPYPGHVTLATFAWAAAWWITGPLPWAGAGMMPVIGVPHNAIVMAALLRLTGRQLGFFEWMKIGILIFIALLLIFYAVLWLMLRPEVREVPTGEAFLRAERAKLGPMRPSQRRVLFVFAMMVILFTLPAVAGLALGDRHAATVWLNRALNVWVIPPAVMFLLFAVRSADDRSEGLLTWKDAERQSPWNAMLLVTGAVAMTDALAQFGFVEFMGNIVRGLGITAGALPYVAAWSNAVMPNFISGTATAALFCNIFVPAAVQIGYNPASIAILIANVALGL